MIAMSLRDLSSVGQVAAASAAAALKSRAPTFSLNVLISADAGRTASTASPIAAIHMRDDLNIGSPINTTLLNLAHLPLRSSHPAPAGLAIPAVILPKGADRYGAWNA